MYKILPERQGHFGKVWLVSKIWIDGFNKKYSPSRFCQLKSTWVSKLWIDMIRSSYSTTTFIQNQMTHIHVKISWNECKSPVFSKNHPTQGGYAEVSCCKLKNRITTFSCLIVQMGINIEKASTNGNGFIHSQFCSIQTCHNPEYGKTCTVHDIIVCV